MKAFRRATFAALLVAVTATSASARVPEILTGDLRGYSTGAKIADIPEPVRRSLVVLFNERSLGMASASERFESTDATVEGENLPERRLIFVAQRGSHCIVHYERGGRAHVCYVLLFQNVGRVAQPVWAASVQHTLRSVHDLERALRSRKFVELPPPFKQYGW